MLPATPVETLALPAPAPEPARAPFPWIATAAPVVVSIALWAVTGSPFGLLFAVLGPVVAVGGVIDGARSRRRTVRRDRERFAAAVERARATIEHAHERERDRLAVLADGGWESDPEVLPVRVGTGDAPGVLSLGGAHPEEPAHDRLTRLAAIVPRAPLVVDARGGIGVVGPPVLARAAARSIALQLAALLSPVSHVLTRPAGEDWAAQLPHETSVHDLDAYHWDDGLVIGWAADADALPAGCGSVLEVTGGLHALSAAQADARARGLAERALSLRVMRAGSDLPDAVTWDEVTPHVAGPGLSAAIGRDAGGVVALDLVTDGPHALVAGTTGSGKSELLVSWVLGMAAGRAPSEVTFLLVDFKGGAAFAPLAGLPHVVATLSDLDARLTHRAVESLRAELLRRETMLAHHGARAIEELPAGVLPRLVVVVDEFAALVAARPELHDVIADLAARGRSLGMHLILCTQRPSGVVRDAVLANIGLRISLRVADRADSVAMTGDDAAARLPALPRGRAIVATPEGNRAVQLARADEGAAARVTASSPGEGAATPWCDPLPAHLDLDALAPVAHGLPFGLADLPSELRQPVAVHDPDAHGHLLVIGGAGAGATTLASTLAESARRAGAAPIVLAADPADAWAQLGAADELRGSVLIVDGLDALLGAMDADYRHEFTERLTAVLRDPAPGAVRAIVTVRRLTGPIAGMTGLFGSRLILRQASRDDHVLAGGAHGDWDPTLPPGAGTWRGMLVQVARCATGSLPPPRVPQPVRVTLASHPVLAVIATRPREVLEAIRETGARVIRVGADALPAPSPENTGGLHIADGPVPTVLVGDPDAWLAEWNLLATARREWPLVLIGCSPADHRSLLRDRDLPPLLGRTAGECTLVRDGRPERAILEIGPDLGFRG